MADLAELIQKLSYYQAGGKDPGQYTLDKIDKGVGIVDKTITDVLAIKKANLDRKKLDVDISSGQRAITPESQLNNDFTVDENLKRAQTNYTLSNKGQLPNLFVNPATREISPTPKPGFYPVSSNTGVTVAAGPAKEDAAAATALRKDENAFLTPEEAMKLKVPYGTRRVQAVGKEPERLPTEGQGTTAVYATRMEQSNDILNNLESYVQNANPIAFQTQANLPDVANKLKSSEFQSLEQAKRNFLNSVLRRESGAVISPTEFAEGNRQYFPLPGDAPETLAQKRQNRETAIAGFKKMSGPAYTPNPLQTQSPAPPTSGQTKTGLKYEVIP